MQCICIDSVLFKGKNYYNVEDVLITYSKQSEHLGMMDMKRFFMSWCFGKSIQMQNCIFKALTL